MKKVIFEDFLIFSPSVGHPDSTLSRLFSELFFQNIMVLEIGVSVKMPPWEKLHIQEIADS